MKKSELKKATKAFSRRFSASDWCYLCTKTDFLDLIGAGEFNAAECCAHKYLTDPHYSGGTIRGLK